MSNAETESPALILLRSQSQTLTDLHSSLQSLRHIPLRLLSPLHDPSSAPVELLRLQDLKDIAQTIKGDAVQDALRAARESEKAKGIVVGGGRRERRIRRRTPSPASPKPYVSFQTSSSRSLFPPSSEPPYDQAPLRVHALRDFIREFNAAHAENGCRMHIYLRQGASAAGAHDALPSPIVLRFEIREIVVVFLTLVHDADADAMSVSGDVDDGVLVVETVNAFGPREQKRPHMRSDYKSYLTLSQQITKMVESDPRVPLQTLINLLQSYAGLFIERCSTCERVLSSETHVPPVARVWSWAGTEGVHTEGEDAEPEEKDRGEEGMRSSSEDRQKKGRGKIRWEPRHVACLGT